ncbi:hypothetical protein ACRRTK_000181 [Alexandromys fortis]
MLPPVPSRLGLLLLLLLCPAHVGGLWWKDCWVGAKPRERGLDPLEIDPEAGKQGVGEEPGVGGWRSVGGPITRALQGGFQNVYFDGEVQLRRERPRAAASPGQPAGGLREPEAYTLQTDIRETAFVFAITAAGASHAVTQACSMGELLQCGCQAPRGRAPPRPTGLLGTPGPPGPAGSPEASAAWEWGGCGDDVDFGDEKSRLFMDAQHKRGRGDIRALVQLHNNEAGRLAVRSHTRTECKCHGLSGSCALRTCWQKLPPFREVGARLLERFHGASRVMGTNDGKALLPAVRTLKPPGRADLLYAADSPDFCAPNRRTGSPGTRGRACNSSAPDLSGCDLLCCGRGHRQESVQLEENCLCRFHWCCVVQCHRCRVRKELSLCL